MALVDSHHFTERLHGSVELIEDKNQLPSGKSQSIDVDLEKTTKAEKDQTVLVTVTSVDASTGSRQSSFTNSDPKVPEESERSIATMDNNEKPAVNREASRRYSLMMAGLAAARVEECKANLRRNSTLSTAASPADTGIAAVTVKGGWDWTPRRDREEDFAVRERYFAEEL